MFSNFLKKMPARPRLERSRARMQTRQSGSAPDVSQGHVWPTKEVQCSEAKRPPISAIPTFGNRSVALCFSMQTGASAALPFLSFLWLFCWMLVHGLSHWGVNLNKPLFVPVSASSCHQESGAQNHIGSSHVAQLAFCFIGLTETTSLRFPNWFTYDQFFFFFFFLLKGFWTGLVQKCWKISPPQKRPFALSHPMGSRDTCILALPLVLL